MDNIINLDERREKKRALKKVDLYCRHLQSMSISELIDQSVNFIQEMKKEKLSEEVYLSSLGLLKELRKRIVDAPGINQDLRLLSTFVEHSWDHSPLA